MSWSREFFCIFPIFVLREAEGRRIAVSRGTVAGQENKMGVMPVNRLLLTMSVPLMISMLVQALYNVVDSMFVAQLSENALTAVSLAFPVQNLMISVATGTGVGVNALLSKSLGQKRFDKASRVAHNGVLLAIFSYAAFAVLGLTCSELFFRLQTDVEEIIAYGRDYMVICSLFSFGLFGQIILERLVQSTGRTVYSMITQALGAILNIIFDPILIFGWFGFPAMGVAGAAAATVFGQIVAMLVGVVINQKKNVEIPLSLTALRPDGRTIRDIYAIGVPSIIMSSIGSVMTFGMNQILIGFSTTAAAVFGIYFKLQSFAFMPVLGLNNGMVPIIAYNYGARRPERIVRTIWLSVCYAVLIMLLALAVFHLIPDQLLLIFNASDHMLDIGVPALRIISLSFLLAGFTVVISSVFQAFAHGMLSMILSLVRQLVALLPLAFLFSLMGNLELIWWSFPLAELVCAVLSALFLVRLNRTEIAPLRRAAEQSSGV